MAELSGKPNIPWNRISKCSGSMAPGPPNIHVSNPTSMKNRDKMSKKLAQKMEAIEETVCDSSPKTVAPTETNTSLRYVNYNLCVFK